MLKKIAVTMVILSAFLGVAYGEEMNADTKVVMIAIELGHVDSVREMTGFPSVKINAYDEEKFTLLHHAAYHGRREIAAILIDKGADINAHGPDGSGLTPLHVAAMTGQREVIELLISRGADVNARPDQGGTTPYEAAIIAGQMDILSLLEAHGGH